MRGRDGWRERSEGGGAHDGVEREPGGGLKLAVGAEEGKERVGVTQRGGAVRFLEDDWVFDYFRTAVEWFSGCSRV